MPASESSPLFDPDASAVDDPASRYAVHGAQTVRNRRARERLAALDDRSLVVAMASDDAYAWSEFFRRFRPMLTAYARRVRVTAGLTDADVQNALVDELLASEAVRLTGDNAPLIATLAPYLQRAARNRLYNLRRAAARRLKRYGEASDVAPDGERVVGALCSEYLLRLAAGPTTRVVREAPALDATVLDAAPVLHLAAALRAATTTDEQLMLAWVAHRVPHRTIAAWLGVSYDVATKRLWRLCRRLRAAAVRHAATLAEDERREVERFLRRAGALPPLVASPPPAYDCVRAHPPREAAPRRDDSLLDDHD